MSIADKVANNILLTGHDSYTTTIIGRHIDPNPASEATMHLAKCWLDECSKSHPLCSRQSNTLLPKRVIDVGPPDGTREPRLFVTEGRCGEYATLTHVWGGILPLRTVTGNLGQHLNELPVSSLPATFRDAVLTTRCLGLSYLWIDALCILQDNTNDWQIEASKMPSIYKNSIITIAAVDAANSTVGFLNERSTAIPSCQLPCPQSERCAGGFTEIAQREPADLLDKESPLSFRGWCMQEKLLSPAVLYFGNKQTYWDCNTLAHLEAYGTAPPRNLLYGGLDYGKAGFGDLFRALSRQKTSKYETWYRVVHEYSVRNLGRVSDTLPALSGLAHEFHDRTGYTYVAGLWQESLQQDLLWGVETFTEVGQMPETYVAPSWSWASHHGPVNFFAGTQGLNISTLRAETLLASTDPFGQVTGGYLRIAGKTQRVLVRYNETSQISDLTYTSSNQSLYSTSTGQEIGRCSFDERSYLVRAGSVHESGIETEVTCLPIQYRNRVQYIVMILKPTDSGKDDEYRRIGLGTIQLRQGDSLLSQDVFDDAVERDIVIV